VTDGREGAKCGAARREGGLHDAKFAVDPRCGGPRGHRGVGEHVSTGLDGLFDTPPEGTPWETLPAGQSPPEPPTPPQGIPVEGFPADHQPGSPGSLAAPGAVAVRPAAAERTEYEWAVVQPTLGAPANASRRSFPQAPGWVAQLAAPGLTGALLFYCASLAPSLLPRLWYLQAALSGVTMAIGYAVGLFACWLFRSLIPLRAGPRACRAARWALAAAAVVLVPMFGVLGAVWQHDIRALTDASQPSEARYVLVVLAAVLIALALVLVTRAVRWLVRPLALALARAIPARGAAAAAVLVVCVVLGFLVTGVLSRLTISVANSVFAGMDNGTAAGVTQPAAPQRSGSPESLVPWSTLGRQGRTFVASGPSVAQISAFTGAPAMEPIRVYVGLKSASSIAAESGLAVRELERTGAFGRKVIVVATPTGNGWLNPAMIDPLEYMYGGDTAVAAIQYSYLPDWISLLIDRAPAQEAGRDLFDAIYDRWLQLPADHRPKLVVFGQGLGSFGGEAAFSGTQDVADRTSGVLWAGPTNSNTLWGRFTAERDAGTPEWLPVYGSGRTVRFASTPAELAANLAGWQQPRVVYLQNASDPMMWWSWQLAFHQPDWLRPPRAPDVSSVMRWYPLVTFWQVSADLALATAVPPGHGHAYGMAQGAAAWANIIPPPGWTQASTTALGQLTAN
jgi:uncharacterized membrane protein